MDNFLNMQDIFKVSKMDPRNEKQIWHEVLESIRVSVSPAIYSTWFSQTHLVSLEDIGKRYIAEIGCTSTFVKSTIEVRYYGLVQDGLIKALELPCDVVFIVKQKKEETNNSAGPTPLFDEKKEDDKDLPEVLMKSGIRLSFTFENFAVSSSNQMAWAAAEAVADNPGSAYNPLFLWGGVGVGKTHLMNSVGYMLLKMDRAAKVLCCTGEDFTNDIVEGIRNKTTQNVREKYRKLKALFIDDIQFIAGKDAVQEEFFHTFNALVRSGGQIILTSDRPPSEISKLEERLKSRFEAGLIVDIAPPDFELRCAIVQIKSKEKGLEVPTEVVHLIAGNLDSARKVEGFLIRLMSEARVRRSEITQELTETLLGKGVEVNPMASKAGPNDVVGAVSKYFSIGKRSLLGTSRARPVARPRQILMYLLRTQLSLPLEEVGRIVGGRDHTTVMHAVEKITELASRSVEIREDLQGIKNGL